MPESVCLLIRKFTWNERGFSFERKNIFNQVSLMMYIVSLIVAFIGLYAADMEDTSYIWGLRTKASEIYVDGPYIQRRLELNYR